VGIRIANSQMKLPQVLCFKTGAQTVSSPQKKVRKNSNDSTASTAASETPGPLAPKASEHSPVDKTTREFIPDIRKEQEWFKYWDSHGLGMLSKPEATNAIQKTFGSFNAEKISCIIDALWPDFDKDEYGFIDSKAMLRKQTGLVDVTLRMYQLAVAKQYAL